MDHQETDLSNVAETPARRRLVEVVSGAVLILLATLLVYRPAMEGGVLWDDDQYVSENPLLFAEGGLWRIWAVPGDSPQYYPMVFTSFWMEARLWGLGTFSLHLVNVLLHAVNALLLWLFLTRLRVPGAWLASMIFALHPVHVESVAWITERKNVLSGLFFLLSLNAYVVFMNRRRWRFYSLALAMFVAALLSKTATCFLPVALILLHWWKCPRLSRRTVLGVAPFFAVGMLFGAITILVETHEVGAAGAEWSLGLAERVLLANRALWFYVGKLLWPATLVFNYPRWTIDPRDAAQYVYPALTLIAVVLLSVCRGWVGRGPVAALVCFVAGVAPVLGFINVYYFRYSYVADHFQYHASMCLIALGAAVLALLMRRLLGGLTRVRAVWVAALLVVPAVLGVLTSRQARLYADIETLWRATIARNPDSTLAHHNLALLLVRGQEEDPARVREAVTLLERSAEIDPRSSSAHQNLGTIASRLGRHEEAVRHYRDAVAIEADRSVNHYNLARALERVGDTDGAIASYRECLAIEPECVPALTGLGQILLRLGQHEIAAEHLVRARAADPGNPSGPLNLGKVYEDAGRYADAMTLYHAAVQLDSRLAESWFRMAVCLRLSGEPDAAAEAYLHAVSLDPEYGDAWADLGVMAYEHGLRDLAAEYYGRAIAAQPYDTAVRLNLAAVLSELGDEAGAVMVCEAGILLDPADLATTHRLARLLARSADPDIRDGGRAVSLAITVVEGTDPPVAECVRTLAMAYAAAEDYTQAMHYAEEAKALANDNGQTQLAAVIEQELRVYRGGANGS